MRNRHFILGEARRQTQIRRFFRLFWCVFALFVLTELAVLPWSVKWYSNQTRAFQLSHQAWLWASRGTNVANRAKALTHVEEAGRLTDQRERTVLTLVAMTYSRLGDKGKAKMFSAMALRASPRDKDVINVWHTIWQTTNEVQVPKPR